VAPNLGSIPKITHFETVLIPYETSTFSDVVPAGFISFLNRRTPLQLQALTSLEIRTYAVVRFSSGRQILATPSLTLLARLPNIKHVEITDESGGWHKESALIGPLTEMQRLVRMMFPGVKVVVTCSRGYRQCTL